MPVAEKGLKVKIDFPTDDIKLSEDEKKTLLKELEGTSIRKIISDKHKSITKAGYVGNVEFEMVDQSQKAK